VNRLVALRGRPLEALAAAGLAVFLAASPVAFARDTVDAFEQVKLLLLLTAVLAVGALAPWLFDPREPCPRRFPLSSVVALLYLAAAAAATVHSTSVRTSLFGADDSHGGLTTVAATAALFLAARRLSLSVAWRIAFVAAAVTGSTAAAAYGAIQVLGADPLSWRRVAEFGGWTRPFGTMGHPIHLGSLLAIVLPVQVWLARGAFARRLRTAGFVLALGATLSSGVLVATLSRAAWCAALAGLSVSLLWVTGGRRRLAVVAAGAALALGLGVLVVRERVIPARLAVALDARVQGLLESGPRPQIWRAAWGVFRDAPVLGCGLDTFALAFPHHRPPLYWTREYDATPSRAHNELLHALATEGIVGGVAWCLVVAGGVALGVLALRRASPPERGLAAALLGGWVAFVVLAQFGFAVVVVLSLLAVWAAILAAVSSGRRSRPPSPDARFVALWSSGLPLAASAALAFAAGWLSDEGPLSSPLAPGIAIVALVGGVAASQAWASSKAMADLPAAAAGGLDRLPEPAPGRQARWMRVAWAGAVVFAWIFLVVGPLAASVAAHRAETARTPREAVELLTKAHLLDPMRVTYLRRLGLAMLKLDPPADDPRGRMAWPARSREVLTWGVQLVPRDAYGWASLAVAEVKLASAGGLDASRPFQSIDEALRLDPANVTFRLAGANAALELGDLERARRYAAEAAGMLPDLGSARAQLAHVAAREGRVEDAIRLLRESLALEWYGQAEARHTAQANLASLLTRARSFADAAQVARALVGEAPFFAPGHYQLGRALEAQGLTATATAEYEMTLRLDPAHKGAYEALSRSARLGVTGKDERIH